MIPVSVIVTTLNEADKIERCLAALSAFAEVVVVDSASSDATAVLAEKAGAQVVPFRWDGRYPKKRQWCLDNLRLKHEWVFFVDADEVVPPALTAEIAKVFAQGPVYAGFFVKGQYVVGGKSLRYGLQNNKLCLIHRRRMKFPVVDDLDIPGMGEIEGHYQPVPLHPRAKIGQFSQPLVHYAYDERWEERHRRYARWEAAMNRKNAWPHDPVSWRQAAKRAFRAMPAREFIAFIHCYVWKRGFLDGRAGWVFACSRFRYYRLIAASAAKF